MRLGTAIIVLVGLVSVLLSVATNIATSALPETWQQYAWLAWPAVFFLTVMTIGLSVWQTRLNRTADGSQAEETGQSETNRRQMLGVVRKIWIDGYLKSSLHDLVPIELVLQEKPDAVSRSWDLIVQQPDRAPRLLPSQQAIGTIFDELGQALLILGAPGAGKTTLLLELARDLLDRAEQDTAYPIPVVFHLSSWSVRRCPMADWLVDELIERYYVPRKLAQAWIDREQVLPLLDGLDEVRLEHRAECVTAVNAFRQEHGLIPLAVCCRVADYEALPSHILLSGAISIQPLSRPQIREFLNRVGEPLAGIREVLRNDEVLWELLETPLMLSVAALAYQSRSVAAVRAPGGVDERRAHLFATYTDAMFERRTKITHYTRKQTTHWLTWLARSLVRTNQSTFYLERAQPNWLPSRAQRWIVASMSILFAGLAFGVVFVLHLGLLGGLYPGQGSLSIATLGFGFGIGLVYGLPFGLVYGLFYGLDRITPAEIVRWSWRDALGSLVGGLIGVAVLLGGLLLVYTLIFLRQEQVVGLVLVGGLGVGLLFRLFPRIVRAIVQRIVREIIGALGIGLLFRLLPWIFRGIVQRIVRGIVRGIVGGLLFGLIPGLVSALIFLVLNSDKSGILSHIIGITFGSIGGLFFALSDSFDKNQIAIRMTPNEGIWRSLRNALSSFVISEILLGFVLLLPLWLLEFHYAALSLLALLLPFVGTSIFLQSGGFSYFQHYALRILLWNNGYAPLNYICFLDYAAERIFLRKVGGGYIFTHRLLMEYFATLKLDCRTGKIKAT